MIKRHASLALRGECVYTFAQRAPCLAFLSFSCQGEIALELDGIAYSTTPQREFCRVHFPAPAGIHTVKITTAYAVVSDLRTWTEELPADILDNMLEELRPLLPRIPCGTLDAQAGENTVTLLSDTGFLEKNAVIAFGGELHEVRNVNGTGVEFYSSFAGERVVQDYNGPFAIEVVIKKGYYDLEAALPGVTLWYDMPRPNGRDTGPGQRQFNIGAAQYSERRSKNYTWDITVETAARSPHLLQTIAAAVRGYLAQESVVLHGLKTWMRFTEAAVNDEPSEAFDILPRVVYRVSIDIEEGNQWQSEIQGQTRLTVNPPMPRR
jgi:hypothetical protein